MRSDDRPGGFEGARGRAVWRMARAALAAAAIVPMASVSARAQIIDRILAVVGGEIILLSDARAAMAFGLVESTPEGTDPIRATLNALIDRQLQLFEVNRYLPPDPPEAAVDARLEDVRERFAGDTAYSAALAEVGLVEAQLRSRIRDDLRIESYRAQRFGAALQPTEEDLLRYYRAHEDRFTSGGVLQPYDEVRARVREQLVRERGSTLIGEWLETMRRRTDVQILYIPGGA